VSKPPRPREIPKAVSDSTTRVTTSDLSEKGIEDLRVLSESKFLYLVQRLVEDAVEKRLHAQKSASAPSDVVVLSDVLEPSTGETLEELGADTSSEFNTRWNELRAKHVQALENIEARLSHLGSTVAGMAGIDHAASGRRDSTTPASTDAGARKRRELLHRAVERSRGATATSGTETTAGARDPTPPAAKA
jgi:hypothetical protein